MIIVFDLDDTLYEELSYVKSGFKEVSQKLEINESIKSAESLNFMIDYLKKNGRKFIFNALLEKYKIYNKKNLQKYLICYRKHKPNIKIDAKIKKSLVKLNKEHSLYLLTDGNKLVQSIKVDTLGIKYLFKKVYITHRYGLKSAKPSLNCFKKIKYIEKCEWSEIVYVGDNPLKDFVNLNKVGAQTVRILQGPYKKTIPKKGYDAKFIYESIYKFFLNYE